MMSAYAALMYGVLIGYGICKIIHNKDNFKSDWAVLFVIYFILLFLSLKVPL